ncbi:COL19A1 isoform 2 [Pongo abelii]|uniref:COL19A1 isoform 2 n=1 Tax=Pongo abelii TaxID=9601 RepID=A0A2J8XWT5_PONAB|nr:COL19A1 isoform 2 [Pongo abelii]
MSLTGPWKLWLWMSIFLLPASTSVTIRDKTGIQANSLPNHQMLFIAFKSLEQILLRLKRP